MDTKRFRASVQYNVHTLVNCFNSSSIGLTCSLNLGKKVLAHMSLATILYSSDKFHGNCNTSHFFKYFLPSVQVA